MGGILHWIPKIKIATVHFELGLRLWRPELSSGMQSPLKRGEFRPCFLDHSHDLRIRVLLGDSWTQRGALSLLQVIGRNTTSAGFVSRLRPSLFPAWHLTCGCEEGEVRSHCSRSSFKAAKWQVSLLCPVCSVCRPWLMLCLYFPAFHFPGSFVWCL